MEARINNTLAKLLGYKGLNEPIIVRSSFASSIPTDRKPDPNDTRILLKRLSKLENLFFRAVSF